MKLNTYWSRFTLAAFAAGLSIVTWAGEPGGGEKTERGNQELRELKEHHHRLMQDGRKEEAQQVRQRIEAIQMEVNAAQFANRVAAKEKLKALMAAGRMEEAAELRAKLGDAGEKKHPDRAEKKEKRPEARRPEKRVPGARGPGGAEERFEHVRIAAEHLHAAGLHEPAERLMQEVKNAQHGPNAERHFEGQLEELRGQIRALREEVERLQMHLKERRP